MSANSSIAAVHAIEIALLTVCADRQTVDQVANAGIETRWSLSRTDFDSYFSAAARPHFSPEIKGAQACVAVVDFDADPEQALEAAGYLDRAFYGRIAIIGLSSSPADPGMLVRAMRAGCSEFLGKPLNGNQFLETLKRLDARWADSLGRQGRNGEVLSFFGTKGGVGATILAVHLGLYLVQCHKKKTLVIDNHRELGHVSVYLGLEGNRYHFRELLRNVDRLDSELLEGFIARHSSGLDVLSSPAELETARVTDTDAIERTLDFLRGEYDYILLDDEANLESATMAALGRSDHIYLIATPEVGAIRDLSCYVDNLFQLESVTNKLHIIINRFSSRDAINTQQIEKAIRQPISIKIPNSYNELVHAINVGAPVSPEKNSDFSAHIRRWADALVGTSEGQAAAPKKKHFALWR